MEYKLLWLLVEGNDDERFFERIIKPKFEKKYDEVRLLKYAQVKNMKVYGLIKSIESMKADYIYVVDINRASCITEKKQKIKKELQNINPDRIIVVVTEIESWYLAGLDEESSKKLKVSPLKTTDTITKEQFNDRIPKRYPRLAFMSEILKHFSIKIANQKNTSFEYFLKRYNCNG